MIDRGRIGYTTPPSAVTIDAWRVQLFCRATGETDPSAWSPHAVVPPTFLKAMETEHYSSAALLTLLDVPLHGVLHAEQSFDHHAPVRIGDELQIERRIERIEDKKDGALTFITVDTNYRLAARLAARSRQVILVRNRLPST